MTTTCATVAVRPGLHQLRIVLMVGLDHQADGVAMFIPAVFLDADACGEFGSIEISKAANLTSPLRLG